MPQIICNKLFIGNFTNQFILRTQRQKKKLFSMSDWKCYFEVWLSCANSYMPVTVWLLPQNKFLNHKLNLTLDLHVIEPLVVILW